MELDREDRNWLDAKFADVHTRITKSDEKNAKALNDQTAQLTAKIGHVQNALQVHEASPCIDVVKHEANHHDAKKFWGMLAAIVAVGAGIGALLMWLIKTGSTRP